MKTEYDFSKGERGRFYRGNAKVSLPTLEEKAAWIGPEGPLGEFIVRETKKTLDSYRVQPHRVTEDANDEQFTAYGGYAHRQLFELVQNSADALLDAPKGKSILIRLTERFLYCADDGEPIDQDGVTALMFSRLSSKRRTGQIGRFGLGFKSVLRVSNAPEFYSRPGSFRFDSTRAARQIAEITPAERYPVLRLPEPIDPCNERDIDAEMQELMSWATNIVRLPLKSGAHDDLAQQIRDFPPEFLLFVDHVGYLTLEDGEVSRSFILQDRQGELHLDTGEGTTRWRPFNTTHSLSAEARSDWILHEDSGKVPISWAAPLDRLDRPGHFWAFFPTNTASLLAGILNAPWKTNEDRQNLLPGPYNEELIEAAAAMIAEALPKLATNEDPVRHLDALPRRHQGGDSEQADLLRKHLFRDLHEREIVPDQDGNLHARKGVSYPPKELTRSDQIDAEPFERWAAYPGRPPDWLHHRALTRNRLATIDRLFHPEGEPPGWSSSGAPRAGVQEWLQALVEGKEADEAIRASMAAIQTAVLVPGVARSEVNLAKIVLTRDGSWQSPNPEHLFLPDEALSGGEIEEPGRCVHPKLASDGDTLAALKKLDLKPPSPESRFRRVAKRVLGSGDGPGAAYGLSEFWVSARKLSVEHVVAIIREHRDWKRVLWRKLLVKTRAEDWRPLYSVLLPGKIVSSDGSRDKGLTVDTRFHEADVKLLRALGVTETLSDGWDLSVEPWFQDFLKGCRQRFTSRDLKRTPRSYLLNFKTNIDHGPLQVLCDLSDEGRSRCTDVLLSIDATYHTWMMQHESSDIYPLLQCESPAIFMLRKYGRIQTAGGIFPLEYALGLHPKSPEAHKALLAHPKAGRIKAAFNLAEPTPETPEFFGAGDSVPLTDIWPGLEQHLPVHRRTCCLVRCERILLMGKPRDCVFHASNIYLSDSVGDDKLRGLRAVVRKLNLGLKPQQIEAILHRRTPQEIKRKHEAIRQCSTDAERLLAAVGEEAVRKDLPDSLIAVLESYDQAPTGADLAEAAIATWHTDALKQYRWALDRLGPPSQWAGSQRAVDFVQVARVLPRMGRRAGGETRSLFGNRRPVLHFRPFMPTSGPSSTRSGTCCVTNTGTVPNGAG